MYNTIYGVKFYDILILIWKFIGNINGQQKYLISKNMIELMALEWFLSNDFKSISIIFKTILFV